jgi:hypothetical protein
LRENRRKGIKKTKAAENRLRSLVHRSGVPPGSARTLQLAIIQSTFLYGSKLTWSGQEPEAKDYQLTINRIARASTRMLPSTPLGPLIAESGLTPAIHLLNYHQSRYAQRLYQNPQNSAGPKEIIEGESQLAETLQKASQLGKETRIECLWNEDA